MTPPDIDYDGGKSRRGSDYTSVAWPAILAHVPRLRQIRLSDFLRTNVFDALAALGTLAHVEDLDLTILREEVDREYEVDHPLTLHFSYASRSRLKHVHLGGEIDSTTALSILSPHLNTLPSLSLSFTDAHINLPLLSNLSTLTIDYVSHLTVCAALASAPPTLRHLKLRKAPFTLPFDMATINADYIEQPDLDRTDHFERLLDSIPSSVTRLSLNFYLSLSNELCNERWGHLEDFRPVLSESVVLLKALNRRDKRGKNGVATWLPSLANLDVAYDCDQLARTERAMRSIGMVSSALKGKPETVSRHSKQLEKQRREMAEACGKRGICLRLTGRGRDGLRPVVRTIL